MQAQSSTNRITTSLSLAHQRRNNNKKTQHKSHPIQSSHTTYTTPWTYLRKAETRRKKDFNLEASEKETSNTISKK